jgi:hypothetical protein
MARAVPRQMRLAPLAAVIALSPSLAAARPLITLGATLGATQSETEAEDSNQGPDETFGLYVRLGLTRYLSAQLEIARINSDPSYDVRTATLLGVLDLGHGLLSRPLRGQFVPILVAGVGEAWGSSAITNSADSYGVDLVAGIGVEYRAVNGVVVGVQARIGQRSMTTSPQLNPLCGTCEEGGQSEDEGLWDGQFRTLLMTAGFAF